jgi:hypothetical protein
LIDSKSCLFSQWFPSDFNTSSGSLSRDFHLPAKYLSNTLSTYVLEQALFGLKIHQLPTKINSWMTSLLCNQLQGEPWLNDQQTRKFVLGINKKYNFSQVVCMMTGTSKMS